MDTENNPPKTQRQMTEQNFKMNKIEYALKLAKDCTYADEMTEGAKEHLRNEIDLALNELSDRDQFAIGFAEWVGNRPLPEFSESTKTWRWWNNDTLKYEFATTSELLDLYKQSLKTDKA